MVKDPREIILSLEEQMEFWKQQFQNTKKLLVTSAKGKQDFKNWRRYFSLTLFEFWYERYDHLFFSRKKTPEGLKTCNFIKKRLQNWCFSCDYWVIFKNTFFTAHLRWLVVYTEWMNLLFNFYLINLWKFHLTPWFTFYGR